MDPDDRPAPSGPTGSPEVALTVGGLLGGVLAAAVGGGLGWVLAGATDGVAAAVGALVPAGLALASLPFLVLGGLLGQGSVIAGASMVALGFRLVLAVMVFVLLARHTDLSFTALGLGLAAGLVGTIAGEMRSAIRDPRIRAADEAAAAHRARQTAQWITERDSRSSGVELRGGDGPAYLPTSRPRRTRR